MSGIVAKDLPASSIDPSLAQNPFLRETASRSLKITCYGSSSAKTPEAYLKEARSLGYILAKRGHVCINGAGSFGCMAAMNDGAMEGNGHIVGVIHEMFLVDDGYGGKTVDRDGGAHPAFRSAVTKTSQMPFGEPTGEGPIREILVAGGNDLQQRKKMLVEKAEGLVVLPGGPGTWDELWEMACSRHLGLIDLPIVCVNVNGYYQPFQEMLYRAYQDELIKLRPEEIVHFVDTAEEAVRWMEETKLGKSKGTESNWKRATSALKKSSFMSAMPLDLEKSPTRWYQLGFTFVLGLACGAGFLLSTDRKSPRLLT